MAETTPRITLPATAIAKLPAKAAKPPAKKAVRGKRNPALLQHPPKVNLAKAPRNPVTTGYPGYSYVVGVKPLLTDAGLLQPGTPVPGAENWPRVEAWVRARRLVAV